MSRSPVFPRLALIGIGLIGVVDRAGRAAVAGARRRMSPIRQPDAGDAEARRGTRARRQLSCRPPPRRSKDADCVILCIPVGASGEATRAIAASLKPGAIVSDVGSVKASVDRARWRRICRPASHFVPAHPVAGTEYSGPGRRLRRAVRQPLVHPDAAAGDRSRRRSSGLPSSGARLGANVETMAAEHHDLVLAITSHVPHLIAYNIVGTAADLETVTQSEVMKFSAGGFRDFTRIAASDPTMWRDVFLNNREAVLEMLGRFTEDLTALQRAIRYGEGDKLFDLFTRTRAIRRGIIAAGQETAAADFGRPHGKTDGDATG